MELPIHQCRSSLQMCVDPLLTVGTARRVPCVGNTDDRQTAAARQHWAGVEPLKHRLRSLLSDLHFTTSPDLLFVGREERGRARLTIGPHWPYFYVGSASDASAQRAYIYVFCIRIVDYAKKSVARSKEPVPSMRSNSLQRKTPSLETRAS